MNDSANLPSSMELREKLKAVRKHEKLTQK